MGTGTDQYDNGYDIDQYGNLIWGNSENYPSSLAWFGVGADGITILNVPAGILVVDPSAFSGSLPTVSTTPPNSSGPIPTFWNGSVWVGKFFPNSSTYFQVDSSPLYYYNVGPGADLVLDARTGWPASNVFQAPLPQYVYVNGVRYSPMSMTNQWVSSGGDQYGDTTYYEPPDSVGYLEIQRNASGGNPPTGVIWIDRLGNGQVESFGVDPSTWQLQGVPDDLAISWSVPSAGTPTNGGPAMICWNDNLLAFYYTSPDGKDWYWAADDGDGSGDYSMVVAPDTSVTAFHGSTTLTGTYASTGFNFGGTPGTSDIIALDSAGNPYPGELPLGINLLFGANGPGQQILGNDGTPYSPPTYSYRRPDGSWGWRYSSYGMGTSLPDGVYLVQDEVGNYTAPPYKFQAATGDTVIKAISGWPATNIYPPQLYINGILSTLVTGSQYDSGAGFPRNGGASYRAAAYDLTVVLSWNWDTSTGFQGFITGKYGQSSSFKGNWDGLGNFTNITNGAIVSMTAPTTTPTDGNPPQISVNGTALQYNSLASAALANAGTPGDVYTGSLGQGLTIYQNGTTSFTPGAGGTAITGTYNATTHQFSFGTGGNSVTVTNSDGSTSNAVITATDTGGHNLATPIGGATNGNGVTELAGGLDIRGNSFTLGSWTTGNESVFGLGIAYGDAVSGSGSTAQLNLSTTRAAVDWNWIHPSTDGGSDQVTAMQLEATHRVLLYDPSQTGNIGIVLDPNGANGNTGVRGTIRVWQRGDISMGQYVHGTQPPVPNGSPN